MNQNVAIVTRVNTESLSLFVMSEQFDELTLTIERLWHLEMAEVMDH